jgi:hypothetical protein
MTQLTSKKLFIRQVQKATSQTLRKLVFHSKLNPELRKAIFLHGKSDFVVAKLASRFKIQLKKGDKELLGLFNRNASEKINPNPVSRKYIIQTLYELARDRKEKGTLRGLLVGVRDSDRLSCEYALWGLKILAKQGEKGTLPGLLYATKLGGNMRAIATEGLMHLAKLGVEETLPGLMLEFEKDLMPQTVNQIRSNVRQGLIYLAELGNKEAQKRLTGNK